MTRSQLRSVLLLDEALRCGARLGASEARDVLRAVMLASGARFMTQFQPELLPEQWASVTDQTRASYARALVRRLFNASIADVRTEPATLAFNVTSCRFVTILTALGRNDLAPLFCEVDDAFAARAGSRIELTRTGTLAAGASCCDFRFSFR